MTTPVDHDIIEQLARAVFGQISELTGTRGTGRVLVDNTGGADAVTVEQNMYLLPVVGSDAGAGLGELRDDLAFKTKPNPATAAPHGQGGEWVVPAGETLEVAVWSNLGGARHNLKAGTVFRWDPPQFGLGPTVVLVADIVDAAEKADDPRVLSAAYYEELDAQNLAHDLQSGRLYRLPGIMLIWQQSTPGEGRTAGTNQGSTRLMTGVRIMSETFQLFVISDDHSSDKKRRGSGLRIMQAVTRLITDQQQTRDWEFLSNVGSLEILSRSRFTRQSSHYVYGIAFRMMRSLSMVDNRQFTPWLQTHTQIAVPGRASPEPTTPLVTVDTVEDNPPGPP